MMKIFFLFFILSTHGNNFSEITSDKNVDGLDYEITTVNFLKSLTTEQFEHSTKIPINEQERKLVIKLNGGIDFILYLLRWIHSIDGEIVLKLPELNKKFGHNSYAGTLNATKGYFKNLGTLYRTGDVSFINQGNTFEIEVRLGLSHLEAGYENYTIKILKIHQTGKLNLTVVNNSLSMKLLFTYNPKCLFKLDYVKFDNLSGVKLTSSGLGVFQAFFNLVSKWFITNFEDKIKIIVNKELHHKLIKVIEDKGDEICNYFPKL